MLAAIIVVIVVLVVALVAIAGYNNLVRKRNRTKEAWSQTDVELKRRHDLIPNLVASVKGYAAHESGTFEAVTASRAAAISAGAGTSPAAVAGAENALSSSLRSLFAVAENYPALRAQEGLPDLQSPVLDRWDDGRTQRALIRLDLASLRRSSPNDSQARKAARI